MKSLNLTLFLLIVLVVTVTFTIRSCINLPIRTAERIADQTAETAKKVSQIFIDTFQIQPQVRQNNTIILEQTSPIAEFAVLERSFVHDFKWQHQWLGSTKEIAIRATYCAKAGFNLNEPFVVRIDPHSGKISADLPPARLLSLERVGKIQFEGKQGYWNKLQPQEIESALNEFNQQARQTVLKSDLLLQAEQDAQQRLQDLAEKNGAPGIAFSFRKSFH